MTKPMMNAARSSDSTNDGTSVDSATSSRFFGAGFSATLVKRAISSFRVCLSMNSRNGFTPSLNATDCVLSPFRYGCTPSAFMSDSTGDMMNRLMNSASPAITWFGGTFGRPKALRVIDITTNTLVNAVHISNSAGATDSTVSASRIVMDVLGLVPLTFRSTEPLSLSAPSPGTTGALG